MRLCIRQSITGDDMGNSGILQRLVTMVGVMNLTGGISNPIGVLDAMGISCSTYNLKVSVLSYQIR